MKKKTVKCPQCNREFDVRSILWNFECPNCEDQLPHEGL